MDEAAVDGEADEANANGNVEEDEQSTLFAVGLR